MCSPFTHLPLMAHTLTGKAVSVVGGMLEFVRDSRRADR